jgi:hypothetical protein
VLHTRRWYFSRNASVYFSEEWLICYEQWELKWGHSIGGGRKKERKTKVSSILLHMGDG